MTSQEQILMWSRDAGYTDDDIGQQRDYEKLEHFFNLAFNAGALSERERCKRVLMAAHELTNGQHNYYHFMALQLDATAKEALR